MLALVLLDKGNVKQIEISIYDGFKMNKMDLAMIQLLFKFEQYKVKFRTGNVHSPIQCSKHCIK